MFPLWLPGIHVAEGWGWRLAHKRTTRPRMQSVPKKLSRYLHNQVKISKIRSVRTTRILTKTTTWTATHYTISPHQTLKMLSGERFAVADLHKTIQYFIPTVCHKVWAQCGASTFGTTTPEPRQNGTSRKWLCLRWTAPLVNNVSPSVRSTVTHNAARLTGEEQWAWPGTSLGAGCTVLVSCERRRRPGGASPAGLRRGTGLHSGAVVNTK